jgi:predicted methyltransferase
MVAKRIFSTFGANVFHDIARRKIRVDTKTPIRRKMFFDILEICLRHNLEWNIAEKNSGSARIQKKIMISTRLTIVKVCRQSREVLAPIAKIMS